MRTASLGFPALINSVSDSAYLPKYVVNMKYATHIEHARNNY